MWASFLITGCAATDNSPSVHEQFTQLQNDPTLESATFAGGCFWCTEAALEAVPGVKEAISGYTGGHVENPTYEQVVQENTGHREAVRVFYDPTQATYNDLLDYFWKSINPTDADGQFTDRGLSYAPAIFPHNEEQKRAAEASKRALDESGRFDQPVITPILKVGPFYPAEEYHQNYYQKQNEHYERYKKGSGRDTYQKEVWGQ